MVNLLAMAFGLSQQFPACEPPLRPVGDYYGARTYVRTRGRKIKTRHGRSGKCKNQPEGYYQQEIQEKHMTRSQKMRAALA